MFVVGRLPKVTYNARDSRGLEAQMRSYLEDRGTILSVSGATKTGKTVLIRSVAPDAITLSGGTIGTINDLWKQIAAEIGIWSEVSRTEVLSDGTESVWEGGLNTPLAVKRSSGTTTESTQGSSLTRRPDVAIESRKALSGNLYRLIIDDFHYIDRTVQLQIVRGLKDLVFDGLGVVIASVPHRAFDAVRVEKEMTGRVTHLNVAPWSIEELMEIARLGFEALNLVDANDEFALRLAEESFASPHLMQEFCKRLCRFNRVEERQSEPLTLAGPEDWRAFFQETAADTSKMAFDLLKTGPRQRSDRIRRMLKDGRETDIYGAVLAAIAHTGPKLEIGYETLRASLKDVLESDLPQRHEVTRVLDQMTQIAREKVEGEPVLEYDDQLSTVHISDPYFAFFLRWGEGGANAAA